MLGNLLGLYAVQIASGLLPLLTLPYIARVLGPSVFGLAIFFQALGLWLSVIIEYGFNLSSCRDVARARHAGRPLQEIVAAVLGAKILLSFSCLGIAGVLLVWLPRLAAHTEYLGWTLLYAVGLGFSPFWYFQGVERIPAAAALETSVRLLFAGVIFVFVRTPGDGPRWMALQGLTAATCTGITLIWMLRETGCDRLRFRSAVAALRDGFDMTLFRASTTLSTSVNILVLGWIGLPATIGYFGGADKLARAETALLTPVSQTVYPRISSLLVANLREARALARKATAAATAIASIGAICAALLAPLLVRVALGRQFDGAVAPFGILQLCVPLIVLRQAIGMNWLLPMRLERAAGGFVLAGMAVNALLTAYLGRAGGAVGVAWAVLLAEIFMLLGSLWLIWRATPAAAHPVPLAAQEECCQ